MSLALDVRANWFSLRLCHLPYLVFMAAPCRISLDDDMEPSECYELVRNGRCNDIEVLRRCGPSCFKSARANLTEDKDGNCWYWASDDECESNPEWMESSCSRACSILHSCSTDPSSDLCAQSFECPLTRDMHKECPDLARDGQCRSSGRFRSSPLLWTCSSSCQLLDPTSMSKTVTRRLLGCTPFCSDPAPR